VESSEELSFDDDQLFSQTGKGGLIKNGKQLARTPMRPSDRHENQNPVDSSDATDVVIKPVAIEFPAAAAALPTPKKITKNRVAKAATTGQENAIPATAGRGSAVARTPVSSAKSAHVPDAAPAPAPAAISTSIEAPVVPVMTAAPAPVMTASISASTQPLPVYATPASSWMPQPSQPTYAQMAYAGSMPVHQQQMPPAVFSSKTNPFFGMSHNPFSRNAMTAMPAVTMQQYPMMNAQPYSNPASAPAYYPPQHMTISAPYGSAMIPNSMMGSMPYAAGMGMSHMAPAVPQPFAAAAFGNLMAPPQQQQQHYPGGWVPQGQAPAASLSVFPNAGSSGGPSVDGQVAAPVKPAKTPTHPARSGSVASAELMTNSYDDRPLPKQSAAFGTMATPRAAAAAGTGAAENAGLMVGSADPSTPHQAAGKTSKTNNRAGKRQKQAKASTPQPSGSDKEKDAAKKGTQTQGQAGASAAVDKMVEKKTTKPFMRRKQGTAAGCKRSAPSSAANTPGGTSGDKLAALNALQCSAAATAAETPALVPSNQPIQQDDVVSMEAPKLFADAIVAEVSGNAENVEQQSTAHADGASVPRTPMKVKINRNVRRMMQLMAENGELATEQSTGTPTTVVAAPAEAAPEACAPMEQPQSTGDPIVAVQCKDNPEAITTNGEISEDCNGACDSEEANQMNGIGRCAVFILFKLFTVLCLV